MRGRFSQGVPKQISLFPPFSKGDLKAINYFRIALKLIPLDLGELEVPMGLGQATPRYFGFGPRFS
jgi:hypothetical protein